MDFSTKEMTLGGTKSMTTVVESRDNAYINVSFSSEFVSPIKTKMRVN